MLDRMFTGFSAIPDDAGKKRKWFQVIGVPHDIKPDELKALYRRMIKQKHPDHGGSPEEFRELQEAYEQGLKEAIT